MLEELVATEELELEAADDVARAAFSYRRGGPGFSDLMIAAAATGAEPPPLHLRPGSGADGRSGVGGDIEFMSAGRGA